MSKRKEDSKEHGDDEEEDYMSNDFLDQIVDTRPGLVFNRTLARKYEVEKKSKQKIEQNNLKTVSIKKLEEINREETLKKSLLNESNKGFNLMLKMGYEKGKALGSQASTSAKLIEPISVEIKTDRGGLGQNEEKKRKLKEYSRLKQDQNQTEKQLADAYLDNKRNRFLIRRLHSDLFKCQKVCYQLDSGRDCHKPEIAKWYWPNHIIKAISQKEFLDTESNVAQPNSLDTSTQPQVELDFTKTAKCLSPNEDIKQPVDFKVVYEERLSLFLRDETSNNSKLAKHSSNPDKETSDDDDHEEAEDKMFNTCCDINKEKENSDLDSGNEEAEELTEEMIRYRIDRICLYLRETYSYCVWCACRYENSEILATNCPGIFFYVVWTGKFKVQVRRK